jgi:hypothetical protein
VERHLLSIFVLVTEDVGATNAGCSISSAPFVRISDRLSITAQKIKKNQL